MIKFEYYHYPMSEQEFLAFEVATQNTPKDLIKHLRKNHFRFIFDWIQGPYNREYKKTDYIPNDLFIHLVEKGMDLTHQASSYLIRMLQKEQYSESIIYLMGRYKQIDYFNSQPMLNSAHLNIFICLFLHNEPKLMQHFLKNHDLEVVKDAITQNQENYSHNILHLIIKHSKKSIEKIKLYIELGGNINQLLIDDDTTKIYEASYFKPSLLCPLSLAQKYHNEEMVEFLKKEKNYMMPLFRKDYSKIDRNSLEESDTFQTILNQKKIYQEKYQLESHIGLKNGERHTMKI